MKPQEQILIKDSASISLEVITRLRSFVEIRNGIYTTLERLNNENKKVYYQHSDSEFSHAFFSRNKSIESYNRQEVNQVVEAESYTPWSLIQATGEMIAKDVEFWNKENKGRVHSKLPTGSFLKGKKRHLHIHKSAEIYPGVVIDTSAGPVVIDKAAIIKPFSFLEGPLYIGKDARIDNAKIGGGTVIGQACRIGGEVENSIIGDFSNKHHEGFVGHSVIGRWVNLGALATTSDLKNNYGIVKISVSDQTFTTNTIKFGSVIGDYVKIAIGVMLNTGCVIDFGANVVASRVVGYLPPFYWSNDNAKYRLDKFLEDSRKVMSRRSCHLMPEEESLIKSIYSSKTS